MSGLGPEMRELLDAVALGTASADEIRQAEAMARDNPVIARELRQLREVVGGLATEVPEHEPPPELKRAVMAEVRADVSASRSAPVRERRFRLGFWPTFAAAASAVAIALLVWNVDLRTREDIPRVTVEGTADLPAASATVSVVDDTIVIRARDLPAAGGGRGYELWFLGAAAPISAGFLAESGGEHVLAVPLPADAPEGVAITLEPLSNTAAPTTPILLNSALPA